MEREIKLDEKYTLKSDNLNWVLHFEEYNEGIDKTTGEPKLVRTYWETYHSTLQYALKKYVYSVLKPATSVVELLEMVNKLEDHIDNLKIK